MKGGKEVCLVSPLVCVCGSECEKISHKVNSNRSLSSLKQIAESQCLSNNNGYLAYLYEWIKYTVSKLYY